MTATPRQFTDYKHGLLVAIEEEVGGAALFAALAQMHVGEARRALGLMVAIEMAVLTCAAPILAGYGLVMAPVKDLEAEAKAEAQGMAHQTWDDILDHMIADYPAFTAEFEQVALMAPAADAPLMRLLVDHENAFIDYATAARAGRGDALAILEAFLLRARAMA